LQKKCRDIGIKTGLVFQIIDDILDATQNSNTLGKTSGKDAGQKKSTAVSLLGLEGAQLKAKKIAQITLVELDNIFLQLQHFGNPTHKEYKELLIQLFYSLLLRKK
ncbi:MAG: polyprenyl synthetase family protein, partial [Silvanigrellaceae bacterium]|nr:polyprenyl synthetase family protein [Silvanigrellaceae bacterium]